MTNPGNPLLYEDITRTFHEQIDQGVSLIPDFVGAFSDQEGTEPDTPLNHYFKQLSYVPLLSSRDEIELARRMGKGRAARRKLIRSNGHLNLDQKNKLVERIRQGHLAREHLIVANTRLVVSVAKKYIGLGVPLLDLIQEGNLGLMRAVEKFDHRRGFRFSTYATWWIRQTITRALADQSRTIRLPVHLCDRLRYLYRAYRKLEQVTGCPPTAEELSTEIKENPQKIRWMLDVSQVPLSLDSPTGNDEVPELGAFVEDLHTPTPPQVVQENLLRERIEELLATLSPREARILRLRFGLDDNQPCTLEEVGAKFGLTRERIRQIEVGALHRLRLPCHVRGLGDYL